MLVRSRLAGLCRTDLEVLEGELDRRWVTYPCIPGHEWSGVVEAVGESVADLAPGDRVVCEGFCYCGVCRRCRAGETNLCERYDQLGFTRGGGYGELVVAPRRVVHALPENVPLDSAVLIEPASVVLKGLERAQLRPGETIGVVGVGTLGALTLVLARLYAPAAIVAYGVREAELELARRLGATETVDVSGGTGARLRGRARSRRRDRRCRARGRARDEAPARGRAHRRARDRRRRARAERSRRPIRPPEPRAPRQRGVHDRRVVARRRAPRRRPRRLRAGGGGDVPRRALRGCVRADGQRAAGRRARILLAHEHRCRLAGIERAGDGSFLRRAGAGAAGFSLAQLLGPAAALAGDGGGDYPAHPRWRFVFVSHYTLDPLLVATQFGAQDAAALVKCEMQWTGSPRGSASETLRALRSAISKKADGIAVSIVDDKAFAAGGRRGGAGRHPARRVQRRLGLEPPAVSHTSARTRVPPGLASAARSPGWRPGASSSFSRRSARRRGPSAASRALFAGLAGATQAPAAIVVRLSGDAAASSRAPSRRRTRASAGARASSRRRHRDARRRPGDRAARPARERRSRRRLRPAPGRSLARRRRDARLRRRPAAVRPGLRAGAAALPRADLAGNGHPLGHGDVGAPAQGGREGVPGDEEPLRGELEPARVPAPPRLTCAAGGSSSRSGRSRSRRRRRWASGLAVLAPALRDRYDLSLTQVGVLLGVAARRRVVTLLPWGLAADRVGERLDGDARPRSAPAWRSSARPTRPAFAALVVLLTALRRIRREHQHRHRPGGDELVPARDSAVSRSGSARPRSRSAGLPPRSAFR